MTRFRLNSGVILASWALLLMFGCHKKKPQIPPEQEPPTILSQIPTQDTQPVQPQNPPPTQEPQTANTKPPEKAANTPHKRPKTRPPVTKKPENEPEKPATTEEAKNIPPPRVVIQEGGANTTSGRVSSGAPADKSANNQASTQQLLDGTENNLKNIVKRQLSADEESTVAQIRDYIKQSQDASKDGDQVRAHNLALKARLLSDDLVKTQ